MQEERRSKRGCRRSDTDRRQTDCPEYRGPERRNGRNRRASKGLAIGLLAGALLLGVTDKAHSERRQTDQVQPQTKELVLQQTEVPTTVLPVTVQKRYQLASATLTEITESAAAQTLQTYTNDTNGYAFSAGSLSNEPLTSIIVTTNKEVNVPEGSIEIISPYQGPPTDIEKLEYKFYLSPGADNDNAERVVLASLLPRDSLHVIKTPKDSLKVETEEEYLSKKYLADKARKKTTARKPGGLSLKLTSYSSKSHLTLSRSSFTNLYHSDIAKSRPYTSDAFDFELSSVLKGTASSGFIDVGAALTTHVLLHELGHHIVADYVGAEGAELNFLTTKGGQLFFASSTVDSIEDRSRLPYNMGGEWAADITFEYALNSYRQNPNLYNKSLMFFSGTDLLWYSLYAFYLSDGHEELDPIGITKHNNISRESLLSVALSKSLINAYRIYSGNDKVIPSFAIDKESVVVNFRIAF